MLIGACPTDPLEQTVGHVLYAYKTPSADDVFEWDAAYIFEARLKLAGARECRISELAN